MAVRSTGNIFEDLGFNEPESSELRVKTELMIAIRRFIKINGLTQTEAAAALGCRQPQISNIINRKLDGVSIELLLHILSRTGIGVEVRTFDPVNQDKAVEESEPA